MRKISLLLLTLFAIVGGGKLTAQTYTVSDAPTDGTWATNTTWYTIKNVQSGGYVSLNSSYTDADGNMLLSVTTVPTTPEAYWCVVKDGDGVKFYNYFAGPSYVLGMTGSQDGARANMYEASSASSDVTTTFYYVAAKIDNTDYNAFRNTNGDGGQYWNKRGNYLAYWNNSTWDKDSLVTGNGSSYEFIAVSSETLANAMTTLYDSYTSDVNTAVTGWTTYADKVLGHTTEQINTLKASIPTTEPSTNDEKLSAAKKMKAALTTFNASSFVMPEAGKHYALKNALYNTYLYMPIQEESVPTDFLFASADAKLHGTADVKFKNQVWTVEKSDGKYYIKNDLYSKKLSGTATWSGSFAYSDDGTAYTLFPFDDSNDKLYGTAAIGHDNDHGKMHLDASNNLVAWETAQASSWYFIEVSDDDYNALREDVETTDLYLKWGNLLPVTNDAYTTALAAYNESATAENLAALKSAIKACSYIRVKSMDSSATTNTLGTSTDGTKGQSLEYSESNAGLIWKLQPCVSNSSSVSTKLLNLNTGKCLSTVLGGASACATMGTVANGATYTFTKQTSGDYEGGFAIKDGNGGQMYCETNGNINKWHQSARAFWYVTLATSLDVDLTTVGDKAYATVYLPFAVSAVSDATAYKGANSADETRVDMTEVSQLAAENGYLLVGEPSATAKLTLTAEDLTETDNILTGTLTALTLTDDTRSQYRVFGRTSADDATTLGFNTPAASLTTLAANKAFITESSASTSAAKLIISFDGNTEGIDATTIDTPAANAPVYDLSGRRVAKATKGLYIKGGKKILVK